MLLTETTNRRTSARRAEKTKKPQEEIEKESEEEIVDLANDIAKTLTLVTVSSLPSTSNTLLAPNCVSTDTLKSYRDVLQPLQFGTIFF